MGKRRRGWEIKIAATGTGLIEEGAPGVSLEQGGRPIAVEGNAGGSVGAVEAASSQAKVSPRIGRS